MTAGIRLAKPSDIPAMTGLLGELSAVEADFRPDAARQQAGLALLLQQPNAKVWVMEIQGCVVGMATLQVLISTAEGGPVGLIEDVVITRDWRGRGLGRALLAAVENWARQSGLRRLQLLADRDNGPALEFYRREGWESTRLVAVRKAGSRGDS